ncbi:MAG: N-acetyltransferase [Candidatus Aminicenantales bacterium]
MDFEIQPEGPEDAAGIRKVNRLAFGGEAESFLVEEVRRSPGFIPELSLVAVRQARVVGHILFSRIMIVPYDRPDQPVPALALAPMAVHPDFQKQGIGSALARRGLEVCRELGHEIVVVVGHPAYYPRFGFAPARAMGLEAPFPVPDEAFLAMELMPGALSGVRGMVVYPPAFEEAP